MIVWCEGQDYPFEARSGDVLFIAGCLPPDLTQRLLFEHVALVGETRVIASATDLLNLPIYGMPESDSAAEQCGNLLGVSQNTGRFWLNRRWLGTEMGSMVTVWNLSCRDNAIDDEMARDISYLVSILEGSFPCRYDGVFCVDGTLSQPIKTNCLGFICSVMEYFERQPFVYHFPTYASPYRYPDTNDRDFPSPGHLAHILQRAPVILPWCPENRVEADRFSRVDVTLQDIAGNLGGPCLI